jgi:hypothetical protein
MSFPKTESEFTAVAYVYEGAGRCRSVRCNQEIVWYRTPGGRYIPLNPKTFEPHFATCVDRGHFR